MADDKDKLKQQAKKVDQNISTFAFTDAPANTKDLTKLREVSGRFAIKGVVPDDDIRELKRISEAGEDESLKIAAKNLLEITVAGRSLDKKTPPAEGMAAKATNKIAQPSSRCC
jgi:hypothetical protein